MINSDSHRSQDPPLQFEETEYQRLLEIYRAAPLISEEGVEAFRNLINYLKSCGERFDDKERKLHSHVVEVVDITIKERVEAVNVTIRPPLKARIPFTQTNRDLRECRRKLEIIGQLEELCIGETTEWVYGPTISVFPPR